MDLNQIEKDRFLRKDPNQNDGTKGAVYVALNPAPKRGDDALRKLGRPKGSEEDDGAPNVLTGTVIVSCFIQTTALPYRIEMQGNDLTFFDDTYTQNERVLGDTSRIIFTHASGKEGEVVTSGFILEKRASVNNTYDNVLSLYALPADVENDGHNFIFIGRNGTYTGFASAIDRNVNSMHLSINKDSNWVPESAISLLNGAFNLEYSIDGEYQAPLLYLGDSQALAPGSGLAGFSAFIVGGLGGQTGIGYYDSGLSFSTMVYAISSSTVQVGGHFIPDSASAYDLGSAGFPFRTLYVGSLSAGTFSVTDLTVTDDLDVGDDLNVGGDIIGSGLVSAGTTLRVGTRTWTFGSGDPEGSKTAPIGSLYSRTSGGVGTTLYYKATGSGNTGWEAVA